MGRIRFGFAVVVHAASMESAPKPSATVVNAERPGANASTVSFAGTLDGENSAFTVTGEANSRDKPVARATMQTVDRDRRPQPGILLLSLGLV